MANNIINKKQNILFNDVPEQYLLHANQLTIKAWNDIINILRTQANNNARYMKILHEWLIGEEPGEVIVPEVDGEILSFTDYVHYSLADIKKNYATNERVDTTDANVDQLLKDVTANRVGFMVVSDYNEDTGEITFAYDNDIVKHMEYNEEYGILTVEYLIGGNTYE